MSPVFNLKNESDKKHFFSTCSKIFDTTDVKCRQAIKYAQKSMHGVLLSRTKLRNKFDFRSISPCEATIFKNMNSIPKKLIFSKHKNLIKIAKNRERAIKDLKIVFDNKDQLQRIFNMGSNLFELRYTKINKHGTTPLQSS